MSVEAMKQALEAMRNFVGKCETGRAKSVESLAQFRAAIPTLESAIAAQEEVPAGWKLVPWKSRCARRPR